MEILTIKLFHHKHNNASSLSWEDSPDCVWAVGAENIKIRALGFAAGQVVAGFNLAFWISFDYCILILFIFSQLILRLFFWLLSLSRPKNSRDLTFSLKQNDGKMLPNPLQYHTASSTKLQI